MNSEDFTKTLWEAIDQLGTEAVGKALAETMVGGKPKDKRFYKGQPCVSSRGCEGRVVRYDEYGRVVAVGENGPMISKDLRPDPDAPSLLNWIEHDGGECPERVKGKRGIVELGNRMLCAKDDGLYFRWTWSHNGKEDDIVRYAIVPEIEWID